MVRILAALEAAGPDRQAPTMPSENYERVDLARRYVAAGLPPCETSVQAAPPRIAGLRRLVGISRNYIAYVDPGAAGPWKGRLWCLQWRLIPVRRLQGRPGAGIWPRYESQPRTFSALGTIGQGYARG